MWRKGIRVIAADLRNTTNPPFAKEEWLHKVATSGLSPQGRNSKNQNT